MPISFMHVSSIQVPQPPFTKNTSGQSFDQSSPFRIYFRQVFKQFTTNHAEELMLFSWLSEDVRGSTIKSQEINYALQ
ncbi:uncharacterized protein K441DRAFT_360084 [Cenococcum geophilum 1.58]|uniref:Uncharacterized protein n=1 Tax=Cenococcum geophilum 1.58 TaxID=794803 RepID=A0ACC8EMG2_9PEZI|nr:hypothetical protein K441DRAFT_360084 [Cenococcum geophilum 1.58]